MAQALEQQRPQPGIADLDFEEYLGPLAYREAAARERSGSSAGKPPLIGPAS